MSVDARMQLAYSTGHNLTTTLIAHGAVTAMEKPGARKPSGFLHCAVGSTERL
jgi:hypothetical protein